MSFATADHYHVNCNNHGVVHGSSTSDSNYHSRFEASPCVRASRCDVGQFNEIIKQGWATRGQTCNTHLVGYGPECYAMGETYNEIVAIHRHYAHNRC